MAAALVVTDEAEGEGGDQRDDVDVRVGKKEVPESCRSKTLKGNQAEGELESNEDHGEEDEGHKLVSQSNWFKPSREDEYYAESAKSADHPEDDDGGQEDLVPHAGPHLHPERPIVEDLVRANNPRDERPKGTDDHEGEDGDPKAVSAINIVLELVAIVLVFFHVLLHDDEGDDETLGDAFYGALSSAFVSLVLLLSSLPVFSLQPHRLSNLASLQLKKRERYQRKLWK